MCNSEVKAFHFVGKTLRNGAAIPDDGVTLKEREAKLCEYGLHASLHPFDAIKYAPGATLCYVSSGGTVTYGEDKLVSTERTIIARIDATELLWRCARRYALEVIHLWNAPSVVKQYLETGDDSLRDAARDAALDAARAAAWDAARAAAWDAAWAAARDAAWDAAWAAARDAARDAARAAWDAAGAATEKLQREIMMEEVKKEFAKICIIIEDV